MATRQIATAREMFDLGTELAETEKVILLEAKPRTGKTTLVRWFAHGLWIDFTKVAYWRIKIYENKLVHVDMARLWKSDEKKLKELLKEYEYIAIEHPRHLEELWIEGKLINITVNEDCTRTVEM